jgi:hypothetical protein
VTDKRELSITDLKPIIEAALEALTGLQAVLPLLEKLAPEVVKPIEKGVQQVVDGLKQAEAALAVFGAQKERADD